MDHCLWRYLFVLLSRLFSPFIFWLGFSSFRLRANLPANFENNLAIYLYSSTIRGKTTETFPRKTPMRHHTYRRSNRGSVRLKTQTEIINLCRTICILICRWSRHTAICFSLLQCLYTVLVLQHSQGQLNKNKIILTMILANFQTT